MPEEFKHKKRFVRYKEGAKLYDLCQSTFEKSFLAKKRPIQRLATSVKVILANQVFR